MAPETQSQLTLSTRLQGHREQLQARLSETREALGQQLEVWRATMAPEVRDQALVRARDASLSRVYALGEESLTWLADVLERLAVEPLRRQAERISGAHTQLKRPTIEDYDALNVAAVTEALEPLTVYQLEKVRDYETEHKSRVTVLREINRLLALALEPASSEDEVTGEDAADSAE